MSNLRKEAPKERSPSGTRRAGSGGHTIALSRQTPKYVSRGARSLGAVFVSIGDHIGTSRASLSIKEQMFFVKRLSFLIKANVPILESLHMLSDQATPRRGRRIIAKIIHDVANGQSLAKSLAKFPNVFGNFSINIIKVGESSGTLSQNLDYLAEELKKRQILRRTVMGAFVYPAVITVASVGITAFLVLFLFPKIMPVFISLHVTLPVSTRILIAVTTFLQDWGLVLLGSMGVVLVVFTVLLRRSRSFHFAFDAFVLRVPFIGGVIRHYNLANVSRTLGLLLRSGLTLSEAIPLTADTTHNLVYEKELHGVAMSVNRGERISAHFAKRRFLFPDITTHLVGVGERTGNLSDALVYLAELYEAEIKDFTKNLSSLIEPILMIVMGIIVGFIAISIITPIYGITQNIHP